MKMRFKKKKKGLTLSLFILIVTMKELRFYPGSLSIGDNKIRKKIQKVIQLKGKK